jgi:hypothetical protein
MRKGYQPKGPAGKVTSPPKDKKPKPTGTPHAIAGAINLMTELDEWKSKYQKLREIYESRSEEGFGVLNEDGELFSVRFDESDAQTDADEIGGKVVPLRFVLESMILGESEG